ncbi:MAG: bifunctional enoyl-CoA hydratase/phosphate acetyltransferase [Thermaerobacter sp.]|nr:bifunctional enoyl-CoA hydratase/phosphate acetyltransferase [Thermaerobacter sp.]
MGYQNFGELLRDVPQKRVRIAVAAAGDVEVMSAIKEAEDRGWVEAILVGDADRIAEAAHQVGYMIPKDHRIVARPEERDAAQAAVELVRDGQADMLMKGLIETSDFLRAILDRDHGLRTGRKISHLAALEDPLHHRLYFLTDAAVNVQPDLLTKLEIVRNAVDALHALGIEQPLGAALAAIELVDPAMPATVDAANLSKMSERGQLPHCIIDGPLALDNAISSEAAEHKGITSAVAGRPDLLIVPDIEAGNILYKAFTYFQGARTAGILLGARCPIVLTSRADPPEAKLLSIGMGMRVAAGSNSRVRQ